MSTIRFQLALILLTCWSFNASALTTSHNAIPYEPISFVQGQVALIQTHFADEPALPPPGPLHPVASRNGLLKELYERGFVESSEFTKLLTDKLLLAKTLESFLGQRASHWHPKTIGLKEFLLRNKLLEKNSRLKKDRALFEAALAQEFPTGCIVKPATGMNSAGKSKFFYFKMEKFLNDLLQDSTELYSAEELKGPSVSQLIDRVASGERLILQENVISAAGIVKPLVTKEFVEIRVHTLGDKVIPGGTYSRWKELDGRVSREDLQKVSDFVQGLLSALPKNFVARQAWGIDVALMDNGVMRLIEINNNRGKEGHWSGYLSRPGLLGAYARHLEQERGVQLIGFNGVLLRNGWANIPDYVEKYFTGDL